ncbi:methyltransferase domain-containing protein [bacterium AH-315-M05]|nr:methyltransferase domain-containing protein [bacterium AH-315-M05]
MGFIDKDRFVDRHYLGLPAEFNARIIKQRIDIIKDRVPDFCNTGLTLVDVGCGNGASLFSLANDFKYCVGIDISEDNQKAFEVYKKEHPVANCDFQLSDIEQVSIHQQYDRLISFEVIEHLRKEESVKKMFQLLKPGGIAVISVPHKWWIFEMHGAKLPLLKWNRVPFFSWLPTFLHERFANARIYTKRRIRKLLENSGLEVMNIDYITTPLDVLSDSKIKSFLLKYVFKGDTTRIPFFSPCLFVYARKTSN